MNYANIKKQLLLALRGELSAKALSVKLGFSFNQVHRWESGEKQLRWDEFVRLCDALSVPLEAAVSRMLFSESETSAHLTTNLIGLLRSRFPLWTIEDLAHRLNCHASVMKRYVRGEIFPDLEVVLAMIDLNHDWLGHFLLDLLPVSSNPEFRAQFEKEQRTALLTLREPLAQAIDACLVIRGYRELNAHDDAFIADQLGITPDEVKQILEQRLKLGILTQQADGKFFPAYITMDTTSSDARSAAVTLQFWNKRAGDRIGDGEFLSRGAAKSFSAYRVAAMSKPTMERANEILMRAFHEITTILEADNAIPEEVRILLLHSYSTKDLPEQLRPFAESSNRSLAGSDSLELEFQPAGAQSFANRSDDFA